MQANATRQIEVPRITKNLGTGGTSRECAMAECARCRGSRVRDGESWSCGHGAREDRGRGTFSEGEVESAGSLARGIMGMRDGGRGRTRGKCMQGTVAHRKRRECQACGEVSTQRYKAQGR